MTTPPLYRRVIRAHRVASIVNRVAPGGVLIDPVVTYRNIVTYRTRNRRYAAFACVVFGLALLLIGIAVWLIK